MNLIVRELLLFILYKKSMRRVEFWLILLLQIFVKDVWKEYTGWPLNDMERSYKFMVKHVQLWKVAFHSTSPRWIHSVYLAAIAAYYAKYT